MGEMTVYCVREGIPEEMSVCAGKSLSSRSWLERQRKSTWARGRPVRLTVGSRKNTVASLETAAFLQSESIQGGQNSVETE